MSKRKKKRKRVLPEYKRHTTLNEEEKYIRDRLNVDLSGWAAFRHRINCGSDERHIKFQPHQSSKSKKEAYLDLGKTHYEVVCSLGFAKQNLKTIKAIRVTYKNGQPEPASYLRFLKQSKEFYFHLGCVLDNLARLIYILRDPDSPTRMADSSKPKLLPAKAGKKARHKARKWKQKELMRRFMAFGASGLKAEIDAEKKAIKAKTATKPYKYAPYAFVSDSEVDQVAYVRHFLTHVWSPPRKIDRTTGIVSWPKEIWTQRVYVWPHARLESKAHAKLTYVKATDMMQRDFKVIEKFQNSVFDKLSTHVAQFETNLGCTISPINGGILPP